MVTILHVSDMQFGAQHRFGADGITPGDRRNSTLAARLLGDLEHLSGEYGLAPDLVVGSGDLTEQAKREEFDQAYDFLAELADGLGLGRHRVAIVPGNHDVSWLGCEAYFLQCQVNQMKCRAEGLDPDKEPGTAPLPPYPPKWEPYAAMFRRFYAAEHGVSFPPDQPWTVFAVPELNTVIVGLNSTMADSHLPDDHYGACGEEQMRAIADRLRECERDGWLRIGVVHHNPVISSSEDPDYLRDHRLFGEILAENLNLLLHGHTHLGKICTFGPDGLPVLCAGSAGVRQAARADDVPNQYQIIQVTAGGLLVAARRYNPDRIRWEGDTGVGRKPEEWRRDIPIPMRDVAAAFPPDPGDTGDAQVRARAEAVLPGKATAAEPDDLLARVGRVCQVRRPNATVEVVRVPASRAWRYLRVTERDGAQISQFPVGVIEATPTKDDVAAFVADIDARYRAGDHGLWSYLVYDGDPAGDQLRSWAQLRGVRLQCLLEFQGVYDLRPYAARQAADLESSEIYPPALYVPQRFTLVSGPGIGVDRTCRDAADVDALTELRSMVADYDGRFIVVLGDFGYGKTFLLRELTRRIHEDRLPPVVPILIPLRELEKAHSLDQLLASHLSGHGEELIDLPLLRHLIREGRVLLLFDGFDELALRVTYERAAEHLDALVRAAEGRAKVVLTSRTQHFLSDREVETALSARIAGVPGRALLKLNPFTDDQILAFLAKLLGGDEPAARARYELIRDIRDLLGLSRNPRMLSFIALLDEDRLLQIRERDPAGVISAAALYRELLDWWLIYEYERALPPGAPPTMTREQRREAVTALALRLWETGEDSLGLADLEAVSANAVRNLAECKLTADEASHLIGSGTLLSRTDDERFAFVHRSVMEWLVASSAATSIACGADSEPILAVRPVSPLMADFVADMAGRPAAVSWCRRMLTMEVPAVGRSAKLNALTMLHRLGEPLQVSDDGPVIRLAGLELRGADLVEADLSRADLGGADLSDARLDRADLTGADLRGACLAQCSARDARLAGADLRDADLSRGYLVGADLSDALLAGTQFTRAALVGAIVDEITAQRDAFGAALPSAPVSAAQVAGPFDLEPAIAWHPSADFIAVAGAGNGVFVWDPATGEQLRHLPQPGDVRSVAWSPDGTRLAVSSGSSVTLWQAATGTLLGTLVPLEDGWAVIGADGFSYKYAGTPNGRFWWSVGLCPFAPGELDHYFPQLRHLPTGTLLIEMNRGS